MAIELKCASLTLSAYNVLLVLRKSEVGLPTLEIANRMEERAPGITRLLDGLEKKKLVQRIRPEEDRRLLLCRITTSGLECLKTLDRHVEAVDGWCRRNLTYDECRRLIILLDGVRTASSLAAPS